MRFALASIVFAIAVCAASAGAQPAQSLAAARAAAREGKVDEAVAALNRVVAAEPTNAEAYDLLCRLHNSVAQDDPAIQACEKATSLAPANSMYALQLARVYGSKADHGGPLTGMRMVGNIRKSFEHAVALDGNNVEALSDLGEFYVEAPGVVGGGIDKAQALVAKLQPLSAARAHRLAAMIAAKQKDDAKALAEFNAAIAAAHTPESYVDLANFYRAQKDWDKAAENLRLALERDTAHGDDTLDVARISIELKRNLGPAEAGLRAYLRTPQKPLASYARAHVLLAQLLDARGDHAGAGAEYNAALALSSNYAAARKGAGK